MIEVEKKFQPTKEQLESLLEGADFLGVVTNHDVYYDYPDLRYFKTNIRLRNRNGIYELKIGKSSTASEEIEDIKEIEKILGLSNSLEKFIQNNLVVIIDYKTEREKHKKGEFTVDVDKTSYGYNVCEIELLVKNQEEVEVAENKILKLAQDYNFEIKKLNGKGKEYLRLLKPEIYETVYENKNKKEFAMK